MIELLSPVGDFECLKAAVQNGANSVYFGANLFSARAFAHNFDIAQLEEAIAYAKIRGVKTNLTLNTLIKDDEFEDALTLAKKAYALGIDAIIIQDLGLAKKLIDTIPDLPIHGSTQMTIHNLDGALALQDLGFKRVVLSRELSEHEIEYICHNSDIEIECFAHGALCISYSGQCLYSSMIGARSGNRGKCAQPCRLKYDLENQDGKVLDSGYLLSTRDLCSLEHIPFFIQSGVKCLKIEGRMKSPEYVATVTRIYRKYIDLALSNSPYVVEEQDKKELMQVFNRGSFSSGHLEKDANRDLVYKEKPNNMGIYLGKVQKYVSEKGLISLKLKEPITIGDTVSLEHETGRYTISELMDNERNIKETTINQLVTIGRMKGNISVGDKVYKLSSKELLQQSKDSYKGENRKVSLHAKVTIKKDTPISIAVHSASNLKLYKDLNIVYTTNIIPEEAKNRPLDMLSVQKQLSKTASTPYTFKTLDIDLDDNLFIPKLSSLNDLRRTVLEQVESYALSKIKRDASTITIEKESTKTDTLSNMRNYMKTNISLSDVKKQQITVLLQQLNLDMDYKKLAGIDNLYIPLKYFMQRSYSDILKTLSTKFDMYIYLPTIIKGNYHNLFYTKAEQSVKDYNIKGFVVSNIGNINLLNNLFDDLDKHFKVISNYTFNVFNQETVLELKKLGVSKFTISPELDKSTIQSLCEYHYLQKEMIVYGKTPLMHMNYCLLGSSNKCYPECSALCKSDDSYYLKDRLHITFPILCDNIQTVTTIFNSKITSVQTNDIAIDDARIDILDETILEINHIMDVVKSGKRLEGKDYTNGNLNREI